MKKYFVLLFSIISMMVVFTACSSEDENKEEESGKLIEASYNRVKKQIVGNWILDAYYKIYSTNPYIKNGWNDIEEAYWHNDKDYKLSFSNSNVTNNENHVFPYAVTLKKDYTTSMYNPSENDYQYIYKKGIVLLEYDDNKYVCDIKSDGKLYLYDYQIGLTGTPEYRYRRY